MSAEERETTIAARRRGAGTLIAWAVAAMVATAGTSNTALARDKGDGDASAEATEQVYERISFDAADTNGDGLLSEAEMARDAAAGFSGLDKDRSRTLTPDELAPHDPARFARVDRDGDGKLTFFEVMTFKTEAFVKTDKDKDGYLSYQEMDDAVAAEMKE